jgi:hypothetical protein
MKKAIIIILSIVSVFIISLYVWLNTTSGVYYKVYSEDKQYSVYAAKNNYEKFFMVFLGQSGDASGKVYLYDEVNKKIIDCANIPMIWMTGEIQWDENVAYFKSDDYPNIINPWKLPRPIRQNNKPN